MGYPHFYKADPALTNAIDGFHPDEEKHRTHFLIEPVSAVRSGVGVPLGSAPWPRCPEGGQWPVVRATPARRDIGSPTGTTLASVQAEVSTSFV